MSNTPKPGSASAPMVERHGRTGHVNLSTSVPPILKDHLVEYCDHTGSTMKDAIQAALEQFLYTVGPGQTDRRRWYGR